MKKITIALFAIMLTAGFVMAADVAVTVEVATYSTMSVSVAALDYDFTGAPETLHGAFDVTVSSNYNQTVSYAFTPSGAWDADIAVGALANDGVSAGDSGVVFSKDLTMTTNLDVSPGNYAGTLAVTMN